MKNPLIITFLALTYSIISIGQITANQNPNFQKSLVKYDLQKNKVSTQQAVTIQDTYVVKDWREIKEEYKELKAQRKYKLKKLRIETNSQNRRLNNRYNRSYRNYSPYYNY